LPLLRATLQLDFRAVVFCLEWFVSHDNWMDYQGAGVKVVKSFLWSQCRA
jgi:hypothetical protein